MGEFSVKGVKRRNQETTFFNEVPKNNDTYIFGSNKQFLRNLFMTTMQNCSQEGFPLTFYYKKFPTYREVGRVVQLTPIYPPYLTSLCLCVPICTMGIIIEPISLGCWEG